MGKLYDGITPDLAEWIGRQRMFFVATAPLAGDGLVNCSPKGMDTFRILGPREVAYLDLTGSGIETVAHVKENARIVLMFCAFSGPPRIVRLHGTGEVLAPAAASAAPDAGPNAAGFERLRQRFPDYPGVRAILQVSVQRIADSCGHGVPRYEYVEQRDMIVRWAKVKGEDGLARYRGEKNALSLDGLPGLGSEG